MKEVLGLSKKQEQALTEGTARENAEAITDYLDEQEVYEVEQDGTEVKVEFPYAYKSIMVLVPEGSLTDSHGAVNAVYCTLTDFYILQYAEEAQAKEAYEALSAELGEDRVILDTPIYPDSYSQSVSTRTSASSASWGLDYMMLDAVRSNANYQYFKKKVTVAVLDTGARMSHELFSGRSISSRSATFVTPSSSSPYDYYDDTANASAHVGHGTHTAGTIADGTSSDVQFMILKVFDQNASGNTSVLVQALEYAYMYGADIISYSGGGSLSGTTTALRNELASNMKRYWKHGTLTVVSSGNENVNINTNKVWPAYMPGCLAVGSIGTGGVVSPKSNYGPSLDLVAPGESIYSADVTSNTGYKPMSGTSMAAPHISAAAAMIKLYNPKLTPSGIYSQLKVLCRNYSGPSSRMRIYYGYGCPVFSSGAPIKMAGQYCSLAKKSYVYNGKARKPGVKVVNYGGSTLYRGYDYSVSYSSNKKVGTGKVKLTGLGGVTGFKTLTFKIVPKGTSLTKVKKGKKKLTVKWKKQKTQTTGYQVMVATNSKFTKNKKTVRIKKNGTTKTTVKKLKSKKTYYVKVRTYKKVGGKYYYSAWSKAKKQKTK